MSLEHFPPNPSYGEGCFRRLVRIWPRARSVVATVDDTHHAMRVVIEHDGDRITAIDGEIVRGPSQSCGGAPAGLAALVGRPLAERPGPDLLPYAANCTHLIDLVGFALRASASPASIIRYDVTVPDETDAPIVAEVQRGGSPVHRWLIRNHRIVEPIPLANRPLMRGFASWARDVFEGEALEAALMLQRGIFVARGRTRLVDAAPPVPLRAAAGMAGACFSYSGDRLATGVSTIGYVRDFTQQVAPEPLPPALLHLVEGPVHDPA